ncbi:MAG: M13 family metallopeptidase [Candidatus Cryptobacteroides sp.]
MKKTALFMLPVLFAAASCQPKSEKVPAIDMSYLDLSVAPGTDFNQYANGGWIKNNPLKAEYARFGSFDQLREDNVERLNGLFAEMSKLNPAKGSVDQKIVDLYKLGLDSTRLNAEGAEPIKDELRMIYSAGDKKELVAVLAKLNLAGGGGFFGMGVDADLMDSNKQVLYLGQSGLGMGDRDYYVDAENAELHSKYQQMLEKLFTLAGESDAAAKALNTVKLEDALASFSWTSVQNRDYTKLYNPMSTAEIAKTFGGFDFGYFFQAMGIPAQDKVIVEQPSFFEGFAKLFESSDLSQLQDYLAAHSLMSAAPYMSDDFYAAQFDFFSTAMSGVTEQKARWKRAMSVPNSILGEAVGQMYVKKYFPEENKKKMLEIVGELQKSLGEHIANLEWMSEQTKAYAQNKLSNFTVKVGYPDKWKDYSSLNVDPEQSYYKNIVAANTWYVADNLSKMGKATDKSEWGMTPQTVNAYYNPTTNEICFPAAILQPPFFNIDADDAVNYGAIGVVIGHEMTHGFDDQGRLFDTDGNMNNWWTAEDEAKFNEKTAVLVKQYDEVEILPGLHANGKLSLGENIADHGGVSIAYTALHNSLGDKMPADIDGFNVDQRFFIGYAHLWAQNITDEEKARLTKLDVHSLAENRINVTLRNFQAFFDAFGIKEGDPMWRPESERVSIW